MIAPIADLATGVLVFAQGMDLEPLGDSVGRVTAESLVDAGADGVMLNHDSNPLAPDALREAIERAREAGLETIACAGTESEALRSTAMHPHVLLYEPPELIGTNAGDRRPWIAPVTDAMRRVDPDVAAMHAGGVGSPEIATAIMAAGADGTGSTSGVVRAADPVAAVHAFVEATRIGWDLAHTTVRTTTPIKEKNQ
jgi:triosephosphate isomerase (TIM)